MVSLILVMSYDLRLGFNGAKFVQNAPGSFFLCNFAGLSWFHMHETK